MANQQHLKVGNASKKKSGSTYSYFSRKSQAPSTTRASTSAVFANANAKKTPIPILPILPDPQQYEDAPEIANLKLLKPKGDVSNKPSRGMMTNQSRSKFKPGCKGCFQCLLAICFRCASSNSGGLDDLDPIAPRTVNSLEYIRKLIDNSTKSSGKLSVKQWKQSPASSDNMESLRKANTAAYDGLICLNKANDIFKQLILLLTFTSYAEQPLTVMEKSLIKGKTVVGSYVWITTYMLQQLQSDPAVEVNGYPSAELKECIHTMERIVFQSASMWQAVIQTIEIVELTHKKVEKCFNELVNQIVDKNEEAVTVTTRHIKVFRKYQRRAEDLENMKVYDPFKSQLTWTKYTFAPLRVLYKDLKHGKNDHYVGFDVLPVATKFSLVKLLLRETEQICATVLEQLETIDKLLQPPVIHNNKYAHTTKVSCFEEGVHLMRKYLVESEPHTWNQEQIHQFLEVDKITLDSLDLLTLSTAMIRTLTHEIRHIAHITYETTRDLDYLECKGMSSYNEVVGSCKSEVIDWDKMSDQRGDSTDGKRKKSISTFSYLSGRKNKINTSPFDIEESNFDTASAESKFERSIYQDILKELPVLCSNRTISVVLQDADAVFTDSSHEMLSTQVHV